MKPWIASLVCAAAVAFASALSAQELLPAPAVTMNSMPPVVSSTINAELEVLATHANGLLSLSTITEGEFFVSFAGTNGAATAAAAAAAATAAASQPPGDPVPSVRTKWCDADGVEHEVVTPIVSTTPAGTQRALDLHNSLVKALQLAHPPKPCPKPVPVRIPPGP